MGDKWDDIPVYQIREGKNVSIILKNNTYFSLLFESKLSTGFSWNLDKNFNTSLLKFIGIFEHKNGKVNKKGLGGPDLEKFVFKAEKSGKTVLKFHYSKVWEKNINPEKIVNISISILEKR